MALRSICMASNRFRNSRFVFARVFTWLCEVFAWLPKGLESPEWYLHVFSHGSARYLHDFQKVSRLLSDCTCFHMAMRGICMASTGLETPEWYSHVFSRGSAKYLHDFQKVYRLISGICPCFQVALGGICMTCERSRDS